MKFNEYYNNAIQNKFAIGAFNFCNLESLKAILDAATENNSPVICAVSASAIKHMGDEFLKNIIIAAKSAYNIPMFFHLDHGKDLEICKKAIDLGFDSVMIDASALPLEENISVTKTVVDYAKPFGVQVEGELGKLKGVEDEHISNESLFTDPLEALTFVQQTGVNSLAIAIGTSHGIAKFSGEPKLEINVLKQIEQLLPNFPLVLHGASSVNQQTILKINELGGNITNAKGIPEDILKYVCTNHNICKINVDTDIRMATTLGLKEYFATNPSNVDTKKYFAHAQTKCKELVAYKITNVFKSDNRA